MGLSGSGKTTILRTVAGLEGFHGGEVLVDGVARPKRLRPIAPRNARSSARSGWCSSSISCSST